MDRRFEEANGEWARGPFEDGAKARIDGHPIQSAPTVDLIGRFAHASWLAGWADADAGIHADELAQQMPVRTPSLHHVVAVFCHNASGAPDVFQTSVYANEVEYADGLHYERAKDQALAQGYEEPMVCADESEIPQLAQLLGAWAQDLDPEAAYYAALDRSGCCCCRGE